MIERNRPGLIAIFLLAIAACSGGSTGGAAGQTSARDICDGFGPWQSSPFVLPYTIGETYRLNQGNCSGFGHSDFWQYGYDFDMQIGTVITTARDGEVVHAQDGATDGDRARTNLITIAHDDGSVALYSHLTLNGVHVTVG